MTATEIKNHKAWNYISSLSPVQRHETLFGSSRAMIEQSFGCKVEEWPFTKMNDVDDSKVAISVTDPIRNMAFMAVLIPN